MKIVASGLLLIYPFSLVLQRVRTLGGTCSNLLIFIYEFSPRYISRFRLDDDRADGGHALGDCAPAPEHLAPGQILDRECVTRRSAREQVAARRHGLIGPNHHRVLEADPLGLSALALEFTGNTPCLGHRSPQVDG